ncbi:hypothetical protein B0H12DRAFT_1202254 [Mycena haematopus]|nr:hypothetical protein B0H12DRAFT_1202254 [Mycena haematopus]
MILDLDSNTSNTSMDSDEPGYLPDAPPAYERGAFQLPPDKDSQFIGKNTEDGRIDLDFDSKLGRALASILSGTAGWHIKLNIVIQVVGSRGDVQPFIALGSELQKHGHRIRLATHNVFEDFVRTSGLEFYPIGGDPAELMAYMVKNPGLIPGIRSLRAGDVQHMNSRAPFVAEAIIANPPSFAHIHCAQALGIPVHLVSTMPWTSSRAFPHPLANLKYTSTDHAFANYISYGIGPALAETLKIPFTYCWSPALNPKPVDWPAHMDVCGFFFRKPPDYTPPPELDAFLRAGPPPVYIGFGSMIIDDPGRMSAMVLGAVRLAGVRAIISRGWSKLDGPPLPDVLYLGDCPHEWLFQHVAAVVHHGGAGTTACGLLNGKPTAIVPFFGDQPFWGNMVAAAGAGPKPVPHKKLDVKTLATSIAFCLTPEAAAAARTIAAKMQSETGIKTAVDSFHANLPLDRLKCDILPDRPATWKIQKGHRKMRLSKLAAEVLVQNKEFDRKALKTHQTKKMHIDNRRWDPITGGSSAATATITDMVDAAAGILLKPYQEKSPLGKDEKDESSNSDTRRSGMSTAGAMVAASGKSMGTIITSGLRGTAIDIPVAFTEGLRNIPKMYGEEVKDYGHVKDWKSGMLVAGKTLLFGLPEGLADLVVQPYKGAKADGATGFVKGVGKGTVDALVKASTATVGLAVYTTQGMYKSFRASIHDKTVKWIIKSRHDEGKWLLSLEDDLLPARIIAAYAQKFQSLGAN